METNQKKHLSHYKRAARRSRLAEMVQGGLTVSEAARAEGVCESTAQAACRASGVPYADRRRRHNGPPSPLRILAALFDAGKSYREVSECFGVSRQRVGQVFAEAVRLGIPGLPDRTAEPKGGGE